MTFAECGLTLSGSGVLPAPAGDRAEFQRTECADFVSRWS